MRADMYPLRITPIVPHWAAANPCLVHLENVPTQRAVHLWAQCISFRDSPRLIDDRPVTAVIRGHRDITDTASVVEPAYVPVLVTLVR